MILIDADVPSGRASASARVTTYVTNLLREPRPPPPTSSSLP